jgi:hypothetical protein
MPAPTRRRTTAAGATTPKPAAKPAPARRRAAPAQVDMSRIKVTPEWVAVEYVKPYEFNARDNAKAIESVAKSIRQFGFLVPIVIDDDGNLAAGHTRIEAAKQIGMTEVLALRASHLTTEQIDTFRLVDNKVASLATWNSELLAPEISRLMNSGVDMMGYGWSQEEVDCLASTVTADCLSASDLMPLEEEEERDTSRLNPRRGPQTTRLVMGDITLFVPTEAFNAWSDGIRRRHNFERAEVEADILNRLGLLT